MHFEGIGLSSQRLIGFLSPGLPGVRFRVRDFWVKISCLGPRQSRFWGFLLKALGFGLWLSDQEFVREVCSLYSGIHAMTSAMLRLHDLG